MVQKITAEQFREKIFDYDVDKVWTFKGDKPAIIDLYAEWCSPCKMLGPVMEEISEDYDGKIDVYKIDIDAEQEIAVMLNVQSIPAVFFCPKVGIPQMAVGAAPKGDIEQAISEIFLMPKEEAIEDKEESGA